jgi:hypothetical protein
LKKINLIIHVGPPKTATTSLQDYWSVYDSYVGNRSKNSHFTKELIMIFFKFSKGWEVQKDIQSWMEKLQACKVSKNHLIILSDEFFFSGEINGNAEFPILLGDSTKNIHLPLAKFLRTLAHFDGPCLVNVDAIMTIRSQFDWVPSKYAQASSKLFQASQTDFERRLVRFAQLQDRSWCDWSVWVKQLDAALGESRVHVFCLEEISTRIFWSKLNSLCGLTINSNDGSDGIITPPHLNNNRKFSQEWSLHRMRLGDYIVKRMKVYPRGKIERIMKKLMAPFDKMLAGYFTPSGRTIHINKKIQETILETCGAGNAWLEVRLNKDLQHLGYPIKSCSYDNK